MNNTYFKNHHKRPSIFIIILKWLAIPFLYLAVCLLKIAIFLTISFKRLYSLFTDTPIHINKKKDHFYYIRGKRYSLYEALIKRCNIPIKDDTDYLNLFNDEYSRAAEQARKAEREKGGSTGQDFLLN
jgi:hypothetical protein